jgi:hypothetical protein
VIAQRAARGRAAIFERPANYQQPAGRTGRNMTGAALDVDVGG